MRAFDFFAALVFAGVLTAQAGGADLTTQNLGANNPNSNLAQNVGANAGATGANGANGLPRSRDALAHNDGAAGANSNLKKNLTKNAAQNLGANNPNSNLAQNAATNKSAAGYCATSVCAIA